MGQGRVIVSGPSISGEERDDIKLKVKTNQQAFDRVCRNLAKMSKRAYDDGACQYLTDEGERCAIGGLLSRRGCKKIRGSIQFRIKDGIVDPGDVSAELLTDLQTAHDRKSHWDDNGFFAWDELEKLAEKYGLLFRI